MPIVRSRRPSRAALTRVRDTLTRREAIGTMATAGLATMWMPGCGDDDAAGGGPSTGGTGGVGGAPAEDQLPLSKQPYVHIVGPNAVRLRFETRDDVEIPVEIIDEAGTASTVTPQRIPADVQYVRDFLEDPLFFADEGGLHVVHDVVLEDLLPGERVTYRVATPEGEVIEGAFKVPPDGNTPFRMAWLADTSWPATEPTVEVLSAGTPDLVLHGGDLQYQSSPLDTWTGMSLSMVPLTSTAISHFIVGNHEFEDQNEIVEMYERLYLGQGDAQAAPQRYFAFTFGGVRFICLDSETGGLEDPNSPQIAWFQAELASVDADPNLRFAIVGMHRPLYSLSKHFPENTAVRDVLHPLFLQHGVRLVLSGHAHCYEHFLVDGVHYVVDGGAGAVLYDPNEELEKADELRPGESDLRLTYEESHGGLLIDVATDGSISIRRLREDGGETDSFVIPAS